MNHLDQRKCLQSIHRNCKLLPGRIFIFGDLNHSVWIISTFKSCPNLGSKTNACSILKDTWMPFFCFTGTGSPILFDMIWYDFELRKMADYQVIYKKGSMKYPCRMQTCWILLQPNGKHFNLLQVCHRVHKSWSDVDVSAWYGPYRFHSTCLPFGCLKR